MLYQGANLPWKWTAKENTGPERQTREIKKNICETEVALSVGGKALKILSCQCLRCWQISFTAQHAQVSIWPEELWAGTTWTARLGDTAAKVCWGRKSNWDPSPLWASTCPPCHNIVPDSHPSGIAEMEMGTVGTWDLSPVVASCDTGSSFAIQLKKLWRNRWQRSTEASGWPKFDVATLGVLIRNIMQQDILLLHSAFANLREQESVTFPSPSSQLHFKTVFYLLLVILKNFLQ